jgi:DNA-binding XRE family transcriptional regulator
LDPGENKNGASTNIVDFDIAALFRAMDIKRVSRKLSWTQVANEIWGMSADLNRLRSDHPISPSTITGMPKRDNTTCQHALFFLRWLGRSPESFLPGVDAGLRGTELPPAGPDRRLRWDLPRLYDAINARRQEHGMTWPRLAKVIGCTPSQLMGIRKARYAINMKLAMRIVQWLGRPAADFVYLAR